MGKELLMYVAKNALMHLKWSWFLSLFNPSLKTTLNKYKRGVK